MKDEFHPGDRVVIRDWDDMAAEYGLDDNDEIYIRDELIHFVKGMRRLCGKQYTVRKVGSNGGYARVWFSDYSGGWKFSPGMLELVEAVEYKPIEIDEAEFAKLCGLA